MMIRDDSPFWTFAFGVLYSSITCMFHCFYKFGGFSAAILLNEFLKYLFLSILQKHWRLVYLIIWLHSICPEHCFIIVVLFHLSNFSLGGWWDSDWDISQTGYSFICLTRPALKAYFSSLFDWINASFLCLFDFFLSVSLKKVLTIWGTRYLISFNCVSVFEYPYIHSF